MEVNPPNSKKAAGLRPVESVSWDDVHVFIARLNSTEEGTVRLGFTGSWRLPTESEWEYAARAGTDSRWAFGDRDSDLNDYGWHAGNAGATTREVGQKKANPWGFLDLYGQTGEWCQDDYSNNYANHDGTQAPHTSEESNRKVHRGGSWFTESDSTRSRARICKQNNSKRWDWFETRLGAPKGQCRTRRCQEQCRPCITTLGAQNHGLHSPCVRLQIEKSMFGCTSKSRLAKGN